MIGIALAKASHAQLRKWRLTFPWLAFLILGFAGILSSTPSQAGATNYLVRGVLTEVKQNEHQLVIAHEDIPNFMEAMTMPFNMGLMGSGASLGMASISTSSHVTQSRGRAMRRPPSLTSVTSHSPLATPSPLYSVISHHASIASNQLHFTKFLPHESEVLAALFATFMVPRSEAADSERLRAMEAFEIIVKTWKAASKEVSPFILLIGVISEYVYEP